MWRASTILLCVLTIVFLWVCLPAVSAQGSGPEILVPADGQRIGDGDDALCPASQKACYKVLAEGRVPAGLTPFFGVEPVKASPEIWIQPAIRGVKKDGTFSGLVYLGEQHKGAGEHFKIYLLACEDEERFQEAERIRKLPKDCQTSEPVDVVRVR